MEDYLPPDMFMQEVEGDFNEIGRDCGHKTDCKITTCSPCAAADHKRANYKPATSFSDCRVLFHNGAGRIFKRCAPLWVRERKNCLYRQVTPQPITKFNSLPYLIRQNFLCPSLVYHFQTSEPFNWGISRIQHNVLIRAKQAVPSSPNPVMLI